MEVTFPVTEKEDFMPILDCAVTNCYYNKDRLCCRGSINVEGNTAEVKDATACGSFKEVSGESFTNSCKCSDSPEKKSDIDCAAEKCTYNDNCKCTAGHVQIQGCDATSKTETMCASFCK